MLRKIKWCSGDTLPPVELYKATDFDSGIKWCSGDTLPPVKLYKATDFDSGSSLATNFHYSYRNTFSTHASQVKEKKLNGVVGYACSASKREELVIKWCSGDTLPPVKLYKATDFDSGSSLATNFHHSYRNTSSTHAPQVKEKKLDGVVGSGLSPTITVTSLVVFWTSTRELRNFHGMP
ncbi:hypothetical protein V1477_003184 [Vespula maculifrons]|uniref:Uncharacterized protein n=1 Tax=Vespula maculifrons TaxID=7453 RepID=A0ABD2CTT0_VESMC